ncbi:MAG: hypothetical protein K0R84_1522, partial [Clostridia bacterium]|nr:hypothetical protein [Clostridia bacterium]
MDMINRYIYAVTKRLPEKQRDDIEKELRTLIDDMLEKYDGEEAYETKVQKVLLDLGDPEILANNYRAAKRYLIGPQNFDNYMLILKIVMGAVFLGISISSAITGILAAEKNLIDIVASYIGILFSALLQAFAWVTIAFAIAEHNGVKVNDHVQMKDTWNPAQLPPVPDKKAAIS